MDASEKYLFHQIHPLKLAVDICSGFGAIYPLWNHNLAVALLLMLIPPPLASFAVMRYANLKPYEESALGRYIAQYMTHAMEGVRLMGMVIIALGAWYHSIAAIAAGIAVVLFGWLRGKLFPARANFQ